MSDSDQTRSSLLERIQHPDNKAAWNEFVSIYAPMVYGFCRRVGLQPADSEDITQETLVEVSKVIQKFQYDRSLGKFRDWMGMIVKRRIFKFWGRKKKREQTLSSMNFVTAKEEASWESHFGESMIKAASERVIQKVNPAHWQAFELLWLQKLSITEVVKLTGYSPDELYVIRHRILKKLKAEIKEITDDLLE